jgi:hypothetical protein
VRNSIRPTYDSRETGPRYHVSVRLNGKTLLFQRPVDDPFVSQKVTITWAGLIRSALRFRPLVAEILVGGDREAVNDVLELDANQLVPGSTRAAAFRSHLNEAIGRYAG